VIASTKVRFGEGESPYTQLVLSDVSSSIGTARLDAKAIVQHDYSAPFGLVVGTAPASAAEVLLLDFKGNIVSSVNTMRSADPFFATVSFWLIETAKHPFYTSLRAIDRDGNVVADLPGR
jgi:hypothetical protein